MLVGRKSLRLTTALDVGSILRIQPDWQPVTSNLRRYGPDREAGVEPYGRALNISTALVGEMQKVGKSGAHIPFHYSTSDGEKHMSSCYQHWILCNLNEFEWVSVTMRQVQALAQVRGLNLSLDAHSIFACRINFRGWSGGRAGSRKLSANGVNSVLPGEYRLGKAPTFSFAGESSCTLEDTHPFELLCYKIVA